MIFVDRAGTVDIEVRNGRVLPSAQNSQSSQVETTRSAHNVLDRDRSQADPSIHVRDLTTKESPKPATTKEKPHLLAETLQAALELVLVQRARLLAEQHGDVRLEFQRCQLLLQCFTCTAKFGSDADTRADSNHELVRSAAMSLRFSSRQNQRSEQPQRTSSGSR